MKVILLTVLVCTPVGWMWNWFHYYYGVSPAWGFPADQVLGFKICGIPIEDWVFYPITGAFFVTMYIVDPFKRFFKNKESSVWLKTVFFMLLLYLIYWGWLVFGESGTVTAGCFGVPSVYLFMRIFKDWDVWHFIRVLIIVVPTNLFWDIWATPGQWFYLTDVGVFSEHFWYFNIPAEMTPYLGIMAGYFVFGVTANINNLMKGKYGISSKFSNE